MEMRTYVEKTESGQEMVRCPIVGKILIPYSFNCPICSYFVKREGNTVYCKYRNR